MERDRPSPTSEGTHHRRSHTQMIATALAAAAAAAGMTIGTLATSAVAAPSAGAATSCGSEGISATIHFGVSLRPFTQAPMTDVAVVDDVVVDGLPPACEGARVKVLLEGNSAGQAEAPTHLLGTATSSVDPCTQSKLSSPPRVATGSVTLHLCSTPGTEGSDVSAHQLTLVTLFVDTVKVSHASVSTLASGTEPGGGPGSGLTSAPVATAAGTDVAFVGAEIAIVVAGGVAVLLAGLLLMLLDRRSRRQAAGGEHAQ